MKGKNMDSNLIQEALSIADKYDKKNMNVLIFLANQNLIKKDLAEFSIIRKYYKDLEYKYYNYLSSKDLYKTLKKFHFSIFESKDNLFFLSFLRQLDEDKTNAIELVMTYETVNFIQAIANFNKKRYDYDLIIRYFDALIEMATKKGLDTEDLVYLLDMFKNKLEEKRRVK